MIPLPGRPPRLWDLLPLGTVLRMLLTLAGVANAMLALQVWLLRYGHHHQVHRSAGAAALAALAPMKLLALLLVAAAAIYVATRPKRAFQRVLVILAFLTGLLAFATSQPALILVAGMNCVAALFAASLWPEVGHPAASRLGWTLLGLAGAVTAWLFLLQGHDRRLGSVFTVLLVLAVAAGLGALALLDRNPAVPGTRDLGAALPWYRSHATSGVSPFALMRDKQHFWASDREAFLAFACRAGTALVLGPGIGPAEAAGRLHEEFRTACRRRGWRPAFYQVSEDIAARMRGTLRLLIGSEAFVDLESFSLQGPAMAKLRHGMSAARRQGVEVQVLPEETVSSGVRAEMRRLAEETAAGRKLGEMSFSVGRQDEPPSVGRTVGLARNRDGRLLGYVTWPSIPAARTVVLDEVKRRPEAPTGTMELLIATCLQELRGRAARATLGLAPITGTSQAPRLAAVEGLLRRALGIRSFSPGLYSFKAKFNPTWEQRYLVVERVIDLPAVLIATFLLHYPEIARRLTELARVLVTPASLTGRPRG